MQLGRTYIYSNFLKAIMIFATMLLAVGVSLMLTPRTDMSEVAKYTVVGSNLLPNNPLLGIAYLAFGGLFVVSALRPPTRRR